MTDSPICHSIMQDRNALEKAIEELCDPVMVAMIRDRKKEIRESEELESVEGALITNVAMSDRDNILGLARISGFRGETMHINPKYLKRAIDMADTLFEGMDDIEVGINNETSGGIFFILLNHNRAAALVVAGRCED